MSIQVKFFASLRETLGTESTTVKSAPNLTVRGVWNAATNAAAFPTNTLSAINMNYSQLDDEVMDGDEVAFFPPVTGG